MLTSYPAWHSSQWTAEQGNGYGSQPNSQRLSHSVFLPSAVKMADNVACHVAARNHLRNVLHNILRQLESGNGDSVQGMSAWEAKSVVSTLVSDCWFIVDVTFGVLMNKPIIQQLFLTAVVCYFIYDIDQY